MISDGPTTTVEGSPGTDGGRVMLGSPGFAPPRVTVTVDTGDVRSTLLTFAMPSIWSDGPTKTVDGSPGIEGGRVVLGSPGLAPLRVIVTGGKEDVGSKFSTRPKPST